MVFQAARATCSGTANTNQKLKVSFYESNPYNSVSGQRKSKGLASSIMRGARKKTVRNLELPDPGELGLDNQLTESDQNFAGKLLYKVKYLKLVYIAIK